MPDRIPVKLINGDCVNLEIGKGQFFVNDADDRQANEYPTLHYRVTAEGALEVGRVYCGSQFDSGGEVSEPWGVEIITSHVRERRVFAPGAWVSLTTSGLPERQVWTAPRGVA